MSWVITGSEKTPVDPQFGSVSLLLHGNADGSGNIIDSSPSPKTVSKFFNAASATPPSYPNSNSAFGNAIAFDGSGDYLRLNGESAFVYGTGDFTIEMWAYRTDTTTNFPVLLETRASGEALTSRLAIYYDGFTANVLINCGSAAISATGMQLATWYHIALSRASQSIRLFVNGNQQGVTTADTSNQGVGANRPVIGTNLNTDIAVLKGFIADLRITKGVARYTANFTPPTAPFPDI